MQLVHGTIGFHNQSQQLVIRRKALVVYSLFEPVQIKRPTFVAAFVVRSTMAGMRFRKLRIAFSVVCSVLCLLLIALWVRSYWWIDTVAEWQGKPISTMNGRLFFDATFIQVESSGTYTYCKFFPGTSMSIRNHGLPLRPAATGIPFWLLSLGAAVLAATSWLPWSNRFSLRTLLIATTLIAVGLGIIVATR